MLRSICLSDPFVYLSSHINMEESDPITDFFAIPETMPEGIASASAVSDLRGESAGDEDIACPSTPPEALLKRRSSICGESPWKQIKLVQASTTMMPEPMGKTTVHLAGGQAARSVLPSVLVAAQNFTQDGPGGYLDSVPYK